MNVRALRAKHRVPFDAMALRMRLTVAALRTLESMPLDQWKVADLQRYVGAVGMTLKLAALAPDGKREVLS